MKNRMKKLLVLATAATMMTAAFTGCGSSSDGADNNADTSADEGTSELKRFTFTCRKYFNGEAL